MAKKHSNANRQKRQKKAAVKKIPTADTTILTKEETAIAEQNLDVNVEEQKPVDDASNPMPAQEDAKKNEAPAAGEEPPVAVAESIENKEVVKDEQLGATDVPGDQKDEEEAPTAEPKVPEVKKEVHPDPIHAEEVAISKEKLFSEIVRENEPVSDKTKDPSVTIEQVKPDPIEELEVIKPATTERPGPSAVVEITKTPLSSDNGNEEATISQEHATVPTNDKTVSTSAEVQEEEANDVVKAEPENIAVPAALVATETREAGTEVKASVETKEMDVEVIKTPGETMEVAVEATKPPVMTKEAEIKTPADEEKASTPTKKIVVSREIKSSEKKLRKKIFGLFGKKGKEQKSKVAVVSEEKQEPKRKVWQFWKSS